MGAFNNVNYNLNNMSYEEERKKLCDEFAVFLCNGDTAELLDNLCRKRMGRNDWLAMLGVGSLQQDKYGDEVSRYNDAKVVSVNLYASSKEYSELESCLWDFEKRMACFRLAYFLVGIARRKDVQTLDKAYGKREAWLRELGVMSLQRDKHGKEVRYYHDWKVVYDKLYASKVDISVLDEFPKLRVGEIPLLRCFCDRIRLERRNQVENREAFEELASDPHVYDESGDGGWGDNDRKTLHENMSLARSLRFN